MSISSTAWRGEVGVDGLAAEVGEVVKGLDEAPGWSRRSCSMRSRRLAASSGMRALNS